MCMASNTNGGNESLAVSLSVSSVLRVEEGWEIIAKSEFNQPGDFPFVLVAHACPSSPPVPPPLLPTVCDL